MSKTKTIQFKRDFSPRKKGETAELETKLADYYLSIGVAELPCSGCDDKKPCVKCNENNEVEQPKESNTEEVEQPIKKHKKQK